jgi:hypothetical protein
MDTSSLTDSIQPAPITEKTQERNELWFGRYDHCVRLKLDEASALKTLDHDHIDRTMLIRKRWRTTKINYGGSWASASQRLITDAMIENLHQMCDFFLAQADQDRRITIMNSMLYVYSRSRDLAEKLWRLPLITPDSELQLIRIQLRGQPGTVILKSPRHRYRSYFNTTKLSLDEACGLKNYLENQEGIRISSSLQDWMETNWVYLRDYYFLDHDHPSTMQMLQLIAPGTVRKTLPIVADK